MKDAPFNACASVKSNSAAEVWGWTLQKQVSTCNISSSSRNICVGFSKETFEMIHTWSEWDTARPTIPGLRVPFAITERIEAARTMPLPRNSKFTPSHLNKMTSRNEVIYQFDVNQSKCIIGCPPHGLLLNARKLPVWILVQIVIFDSECTCHCDCKTECWGVPHLVAMKRGK